jgi:hypothetical protein
VVRNELKDANVQVPQAVVSVPKMDTANPEAVPKMTEALDSRVAQMEAINKKTASEDLQLRAEEQQNKIQAQLEAMRQKKLNSKVRAREIQDMQEAREATRQKKLNSDARARQDARAKPMSAAERNADADGIPLITRAGVPTNATGVEPEYDNPIFDGQGTQQEITTDINPSRMEPRSEPLAPEGTNDIEPSVLDNVGAFNEEAMPDGPIEEVEKLSPVLDKIAEAEAQFTAVSNLLAPQKSGSSLGNTFTPNSRGSTPQIGSPPVSNQTSPLETPPSSAERPPSARFRPTRPNNQNTKPNTDSPGLGTSEDSAEQSVAELGEDIRKPVETSMNSSEEFDELGEDTLIRDPFGTMERESVVNLGEVFPNEQPDPQTSQPEDNSIPSDGDLTTADKIRELQNQYNELYRSSTPETLSNSEIGGKLGDITNQLIALGGYSAIPLGTIQSQQMQPGGRTIGQQHNMGAFAPVLDMRVDDDGGRRMLGGGGGRRNRL